MNQIFSLKRFVLLFKKHTIENYRGYLLSIGVLFGLLSISVGSAVYNFKMPLSIQGQAINYIIFLLFSGTIFTSNVFVNLGEKRRTIATLTLPASSFEKYFVGWLYSFVIFQLVFTGIFYSLLFIIANSTTWPAGSVHYLSLFNPSSPLDAEAKMPVVFFVYVILHSLIIFGAIYFNKMHFIKTVFAVFVIGLIIWLLNDHVLQLMTGLKTSGNPPFTGLSFHKDIDSAHRQVYYNLDLKNERNGKWAGYLALLISVIIWCAAYFKLKEKQV